ARSSRRLDPDRLHVQVLLELLQSRLAAVAAHLVPTEWHRRIHGLVAVYPNRAGPNALGQSMRLADVARPHAAAEAEQSGVGPADHLVDVRERNGRDDGPEDLLLGDPHLIPDVHE